MTQFPQPTEWTDQKTGEPIRLYSFHHIREWESDQWMREMCRQKKLAYVEPSVAVASIDELIA